MRFTLSAGFTESAVDAIALILDKVEEVSPSFFDVAVRETSRGAALDQ